MHFKYGALLNIVFVTMTYGFGIPILFPIAAAAIFVLWIVEKSMLFYAYRLPPMYDERLSEAVLNYMYWAPLFYLGFGYWMASNKQLLSNDYLEPKDRMTTPDIHLHTIDRVFAGDGMSAPAWPLLLLFTFMFLNQILGSAVMRCLTRCFPNLEIGDVELDEDIDNYWASLDDKDRNWAIKEDQHATDTLGLQLLTKKQKASLLSSSKTQGRTLQGCHSYDILANPLYFDDFQYVSASLENRENYIIDDDDEEGNDAVQSDIVRYALNLAYMNEREARAFEFDQESVAARMREGNRKGLL